MPAFKIFATLLTAATHCNWGGEAINTRAVKQSHVIGQSTQTIALNQLGSNVGKEGEKSF